MYNGELITFKIKDKENLICKSLFDIDVELNETGLLLKNKDGSEIGYFESEVGIDLAEMMRLFGFELAE